MNHTEFTQTLAVELGTTHTRAADIASAVRKVIKDALMAGEDVTIGGLVKLSAVKKAASIGRNPRTGERIEIAAKRAPKAVFLKELKDALNA